MANRSFYPLLGTLDPEIATFDGYVRVSTSGTIVSQSVTGCTVARSNTGLYTLTFADLYPAMKSCVITPVCATATDIKAQVVTAFPSTTGVVTIRFVAVATASDLPTDGGFYVHVAMKNSSA